MMSSHIITPGPYRATKLWNEVTRLFRSGMPLKKHRQSFRVHASCFTATAAVDWLHQLLRSNSNFGPDVTRQQTVQLLKKFLKNHVIEDVKGRWGTEELEDNNTLYRFPSTSPLKHIPCPAPAPVSAPGSIKKSLSLRDKFRTTRKPDKESLENIDPALQTQEEGVSRRIGEQQAQRRELTEEDVQEVWRDITLTHLQKILGLSSLDEVLDPRHVNPQNIIHNMTQVNKHGVVTLDDKKNDLPHWVLSAMKSLANWPKYDSGQPSYPGFERDVLKTVSDYFHSLPQPLLTYQLYELFINVLVLCGYVAAPSRPQRGKRKLSDPPSRPPPSKTAASFYSTECLLLSLIRQGSCDEADSPMREVFSSKFSQSSLSSLREGGIRGRASNQLGGSCLSLNESQSLVGTAGLRPRSCSLETVLDDSAPLSQQLFLSNDSLAIACGRSNCHQDIRTSKTTSHNNNNNYGPDSLSDSCSPSVSMETPSSDSGKVPEGPTRTKQSVVSAATLSFMRRSRPLRPLSVGSCLDIVMETREEVAMETTLGHGRTNSCMDVNDAPPAEQTHSSSSSITQGAASTRRASTSSSLWTRTGSGSGTNTRSSTGPVVARRCLSSLDLSKLTRPVSLLRPSVCLLKQSVSQSKPSSENSLLRPQCERVAVEALQLCTLLLPPSSRRRLQLLLRMMSRISQNVDMPRLHHAIGTRTLMVHTFSGCVLGSAEECDLDELLATRLVSFLMDHQQVILSVPEYLLHAVTDHIHYLRTVQLPAGGVLSGVDTSNLPIPVHAFCRQISSAEFEEQRVSASQKAIEELLDIILTEQNISDKDRKKKLKQFQKQYPDIYSKRFPSEGPGPHQDTKPKIKPPLLNIRKTKAFSIRN